MTISEESEVLVYAMEIAAHYVTLYNMSDDIKIRDYYKSYLRSIARMIHAMDAHIDLCVRYATEYPEHGFNIWRLYYNYDGECFGIYYDFTGTNKEMGYF